MATVERTVQQVGERLWRRIQGERPTLFVKDFWQGKLLDLVMADPAFKVDLFRLIDVLPALQTSEQVARHVAEYLHRPEHDLPTVLGTAVKAASGGIFSGIAAKVFLGNVRQMAHTFIAGETPAEALPRIRKLQANGFGSTVDLLGEATVSAQEAGIYRDRYLALIDALADAVRDWNGGFGAVQGTSSRGRSRSQDTLAANVSVKLSALSTHLDPVDMDGSVSRLLEAATPIVRHANQRRVFVNFDLEQWDLHEITYAFFEALAMSPEFRDWPHLGIVVQSYLHSAHDDVDRLRALAEKRAAPLTVRLVKGAYWDYEVVHSRLHGYPCPVLLDKSSTDAQFEALSDRLLEHRAHLRPAFGTHNLRSIAHAITSMERMDVPRDRVEFQCLYGMAEAERRALRDEGYPVRVYVPIGELLPGMAYLVRRLLENTANEGFLRKTHHDKVNLSVLLAPPRPGSPVPKKQTKREDAFENCPHADFTRADVRRRFAEAIGDLPARFPIDVPVVLDGESASCGAWMDRECPSDTSMRVARVPLANAGHANEAVARAKAAWPAWRERPVEDRARLLERLAAVLDRDRIELATLQCYEVAKPWREADADVAEAIDFCRYYAQRARIELAPQAMGNVPGERNLAWYQGRGPTVVVAPWNFPLAILCGMTGAALVAGNTVVMKPAEQSSAIAYALIQRILEAGFPRGVVQFLPGIGEEIGPVLVEHPDTAQIAFTGSMAVGLDICRRAAVVQPGQTQLKKVICEMGGKNAIIVDEDADLDEAVQGAVASAFSYAGQKCSACSRLLVHAAVYEAFRARFIEAAASLHACAAHDPACQLPPVVDAEAKQRLLSVMGETGVGGRPLYIGNAPSGGHFVPPALFEVEDPQHRLMQDELFGPVVALMKVPDLETAWEIANGTRFALTGGLYSRTPSHIEAARARFRVGNLYINRPITGAIVGRQPFGGFHMSGDGAKAGGPGYLLHFCDARATTENTMRHGFTPEVSI